MTEHKKQQTPLVRQTRAHKVGEFLAYSTFAVIFLLTAAVAFVISYFMLTWAFGLR